MYMATVACACYFWLLNAAKVPRDTLKRFLLMDVWFYANFSVFAGPIPIFAAVSCHCCDAQRCFCRSALPERAALCHWRTGSHSDTYKIRAMTMMAIINGGEDGNL